MDVAPAAGLRSRRVRRFGNPLRAHDGHGRAEPPAEHGQPGRGPTEPAGHRHDVAGVRSAAGDRRTPLQVAERGHRQGQRTGRDRVAADETDTDLLRFLPHARGELVDHRGRQVRGAAEPEEHARRHRSHRGDVGEVDRDGLAPHLVRVRPVEAEVHVLHQHVGGRHHPPVAGVEHGGVVTGADQRIRRLLPARRHPPDETELTQLGNGLRVP